MSSLIATPAPRRRTWRGVCALALLGVLMSGALLPAAQPAISGELYKWTDANGVVHYSDSPPPSGQYQTRNIRPAATAAVTEADAGAPPESANCTIARGNLALLQGDQPIGVDTDKDGKPDSTLTADQRADQTKLAEAAIDVHCTVATDADSDAADDSNSGSDGSSDA